MRDYLTNNSPGADYLSQRELMVETQLKARGIKNQQIIQAFLKIPRHLFVDDHLISQAYDDNPLPIGFKQTISQPYMVAFMLENLNLKANHKILEIGTGSGYQTALLAELCKEVYTVEKIDGLLESAQKMLKQLGLDSIHYRIGDGSLGWADFAPYDRIIVSAGSPQVPPTLIKQLNSDDGILICPVGNEYHQELIQVVKYQSKVKMHNLGSCVFVRLVGEEGWKD
ncbi:MAG: protein-L-isoaspartate(D-aspartate) O-methyltransferase [Planctomycetota bacterium]|nr:protein-L-isoaspartate(D-aspartate) O-methyltransferase [Planctomycetota bacterium]